LGGGGGGGGCGGGFFGGKKKKRGCKRKSPPPIGQESLNLAHCTGLNSLWKKSFRLKGEYWSGVPCTVSASHHRTGELKWAHQYVLGGRTFEDWRAFQSSTERMSGRESQKNLGGGGEKRRGVWRVGDGQLTARTDNRSAGQESVMALSNHRTTTKRGVSSRAAVSV